VPAIPYITLKFKDDFKIEYRDGDGERLPFWGQLNEMFPGIELLRLYRLLEVDAFKALIAFAQKSAASRDERYDPPRFFQWFRVTAPPHTAFGRLAEVLRSQAEVEAVFIEQPGSPPQPIGNPGTNPQFVNQLYLRAPVQPGGTIGGINAVHAWNWTVGTGVKVVDYERGWGFTFPAEPPPAPNPIAMNHSDLPAVNRIPFGIHNDPSCAEHGTNVLGMLAMTDNSAFGVGATPGATVYVVTPVTGYDNKGKALFSHADALLAAINLLRPLPRNVPVVGDVLLIEHCIDDPSVPPPLPGTPPWPPRKQVPLELIPGNLNVIELATKAGITVVEAAGNGRSAYTPDPRLNLDTWPSATGPHPFLPNPANFRDDNVQTVLPFRDSGAILVSCANMIAGEIPWAPSWAPIGRRIDCWGWASSAQTTSTNTEGWKLNFGGTSAAAAMVAGAAILLHAHARAAGIQLGPREARRKLCNPAAGHTAAGIQGVSAPNTTSPLVGVMPDLAQVIPIPVPIT